MSGIFSRQVGIRLRHGWGGTISGIYSLSKEFRISSCQSRENSLEQLILNIVDSDPEYILHWLMTYMCINMCIYSRCVPREHTFAAGRLIPGEKGYQLIFPVLPKFTTPGVRVNLREKVERRSPDLYSSRSTGMEGNARSGEAGLICKYFFFSITITILFILMHILRFNKVICAHPPDHKALFTQPYHLPLDEI